jgi:hypothetical protein
MLRFLTLRGWALGVVGVLGVSLIVLSGLGFRWDPFGLARHRLQVAEAAASLARADAAARRLEVEGAEEQMQRLDRLHQQTVAVARTTARAAAEARRAHDAETPLEPGRMARLSAHDRELCRLAPAVCGVAPVDPAGIGHDSLRPGEAAGVPDARRS